MGLRKRAIVALLVLAPLMLAVPVSAWMGSEMCGNIGDISFGQEVVIQRPTATLFHTESLATTDNEALAIAFPVVGAGQTVMPTIAQTVDTTATAAESGYYRANWAYTTFANLGGYDLTTDLSTWHPMKSSKMVGSGISWPYMDSPAQESGSAMTFRPVINTSLNAGNAGQNTTAFGVGNVSLGGTNLTLGDQSAGASNQTPHVSNGQSKKPNRDYKNLTASSIKDMSGLEKMYRNANLRNTIPQTHTGSVARPSAIDPLQNPLDIIKAPDYAKSIRDASKMTQEGSHLKTLFWDL